MAKGSARRDPPPPATCPSPVGYTLSPLSLFVGSLLLLAVGFTGGVLVQSRVGSAPAPTPAAPLAPVAAPAAAPGTAAPGPAPMELLQTIERLRQHLAHAPEDAAARTDLGNALFDAGRYPEAIREYQAVLDAQPGNADVRTDMGTALHRTGRGDLAAVQFRQVIQQFPSHANALHNLGVVLAEQGDLPGARRAWERYLEVAPGSPLAADVRKRLAQLPAAR